MTKIKIISKVEIVRRGYFFAKWGEILYIKTVTGYVLKYYAKGFLDTFEPKEIKTWQKKEIIIDVANKRYMYGFYELLIKQLELQINTGRNLGGMSDFLREPWEEDCIVRFINVSKTNDDVRYEISKIIDMFEEVKEFQKRCKNEFTRTAEP